MKHIKAYVLYGIKGLIEMLSPCHFFHVKCAYNSPALKVCALWLQFSLQSKGSTFHPLKGAC